MKKRPSMAYGLTPIIFNMEGAFLCPNPKYLAGYPLYYARVSGEGERMFTQLAGRFRDYWVDIITGTLYTEDGKCMSSDTLFIDIPPRKTKKKVPQFKRRSADI